jgi:hypothetical protein
MYKLNSCPSPPNNHTLPSLTIAARASTHRSSSHPASQLSTQPGLAFLIGIRSFDCTNCQVTGHRLASSLPCHSSRCTAIHTNIAQRLPQTSSTSAYPRHPNSPTHPNSPETRTKSRYCATGVVWGDQPPLKHLHPHLPNHGAGRT